MDKRKYTRALGQVFPLLLNMLLTENIPHGFKNKQGLGELSWLIHLFFQHSLAWLSARHGASLKDSGVKMVIVIHLSYPGVHEHDI